jgi:tetratricopeptide (TPR) repeat protein
MKIKTFIGKRKVSFQALRFASAIFILGVFLLPNFFVEDINFFKAKLAVLAHPRSPRAHLQLAEVAAFNFDWELSKKEYQMAYELYSQNKNINSEELDSLFSNVEFTVFKERYLREEIARWEGIIEKQPGYRDGYLRLALFYYQLSIKERAFDNWQRAWKLDPNNEQVSRVGKLIGAEVL